MKRSSLALDEDESVECILAARDTDVLTLVEDEILLSLPISPRHDEGECSIELAEQWYSTQKSLFAALAG